MLVDRKERLARDAIEEVEIALLGCLRDGVDVLAVFLHAEERGRRGKIAIPYVVVHALKMPEAFAGVGVECEQRVGVEIIPDPISAVEIHHR